MDGIAADSIPAEIDGETPGRREGREREVQEPRVAGELGVGSTRHLLDPNGRT
jgi:hypothetical protein